MEIAKRILIKRQELNITQTELAKRAGLKPPAVCQYESGSRRPSYEALKSISEALGVTTDYLLFGNEINPENITEKTSKLLVEIIQGMTIENRKKLLEYAKFIIGSKL